MKSVIIDGKAIAKNIRMQVREQAVRFLGERGRMPTLAVILVGDNQASQIYVRNKAIACEEVGIKSLTYSIPADTSENDLIELVKKLNGDRNIDGILVQLPLPNGINEKRVLSCISPNKDVDGFHAENAGNLLLGNYCLPACTPSGIIELIRSTGICIAGKHAVVVGRSNIVGKPMAMLLLQNDATVTIAHSKTVDLKSITLLADILVVAVGKKEFIRRDMIKEGAIVIDVGMNRCDGKLYGDVAFEEACEVAGYITPVPGGVGPMTVAMLMKNTLSAAENE